MNLLACGLTAEALALSDFVFVVEDRVRTEFLRYDRRREEELRVFQESGPVLFERMSESAADDFIEIVTAGPQDDLGDGEAGAIAHAHHSAAAVATDDQKARNVCARRFPKIELVFTVDLFLRDSFRGAHPQSLVSEALYAALERGRMRVPAALFDRVADLVGGRIAECSSIPRHRRRSDV